tara:strand:- start:542 stop:649 length:108 start_codon:yes stop_codon:yes gene_type:complete
VVVLVVMLVQEVLVAVELGDLEKIKVLLHHILQVL